jgi:hypothetical protein
MFGDLAGWMRMAGMLEKRRVPKKREGTLLAKNKIKVSLRPHPMDRFRRGIGGFSEHCSESDIFFGFHT